MKYLLTGTSSKRLLYRPIDQGDFDAWLPFFQNPQAVYHFKFDPTKSAEQLCQEWLDRQFLRYEENRGGMNALISRETGDLVGLCGLLVQEIDQVNELEIGYSLLPAYWGKGYAIEAAAHCKKEAFQWEWSDSLISIITPQNISSQKVAHKNGLIYEKDSTYMGFDVRIYRVKKDS